MPIKTKSEGTSSFLEAARLSRSFRESLLIVSHYFKVSASIYRWGYPSPELPSPYPNKNKSLDLNVIWMIKKQNDQMRGRKNLHKNGLSVIVLSLYSFSDIQLIQQLAWIALCCKQSRATCFVYMGCDKCFHIRKCTGCNISTTSVLYTVLLLAPSDIVQSSQGQPWILRVAEYELLSIQHLQSQEVGSQGNGPKRP